MAEETTKKTPWPVAAAFVAGATLAGVGGNAIHGPTVNEHRAVEHRQAHHQSASNEVTKFNPLDIVTPEDSFLVTTRNLRTDSVVSQIHIAAPAESSLLVVKGGTVSR